MKAFLLAAGHGTRLRPITDHVPKCLVPIRGVPMLQIWLDLCASFGIDEVLINLHAHRETVCEFVNKLSSNIEVTVSEEDILLGSAGTLRANRDWIAGERNFWVFYADVLNAVNLQRMAEFHEKKDRVATIGVYRVPDPSRCGIVSTDAEGLVTEFVEKPAHPKSNLAFSGLMIAKPELLEFIPEASPVDIGFHVLPRLVGKMSAYEIKEYLLDIGTMENYQQAQESWPATLASGASR